MKLWIDDVRQPPEGYIWCKSVNQAKYHLINALYWGVLELIDIDHDAGDYKDDGGDYIELLNWLEYLYYNFNSICPNWNMVKIRMHSMNPVGMQNMRRIIQRNGWKEIV